MTDDTAPQTPEAPDALLSQEDVNLDGLPVEQLTAEQQMARFEEQLKEEDWGHQPC
ncbi:MAG: hypothetical protein H7A55_01335 [Verrucomicrobiaceae bacterium]|nr:hypothetical protein [Verrucomicrobiaceae bacterium]